ncbi:MAG: MFS transporter [Parvibaculaceae bacterium]|nr:MFS transporter [Parvibaculaceae bacterium]
MFGSVSRYFRFIGENKALLGFGLLMAFGSSFGQSFFVGLYQAPLREAFDLSASGFGAAFSAVTLVSAAILPWTGRVIDQVSLRTYTAATILILACAALTLAFNTYFVLFVVALFVLRHVGQGLMSHTSSTAMGRYFTANRGKAVTIASTGYSLGEALFPAMALAVIALVGWRLSWAVHGATLILVFLPLALWLVWREPAHEKSRPTGNTASGTHPNLTATRDWTRAEVMRDPRFYVLIPAMMAPAFILTGFFVHQGFLASSKDWPVELVAAGFSTFAIVKLVSSLFVGPFADRFGFRPLMALYMVPLALSMLSLALIDANIGVFLYFGLAGLSTGGAMAVGGLLWPELYGTRHLGAIRSLSTSLMVFSTALAPVTFGALIDWGVSAKGIAFISLGYAGIAVAMLLTFLWHEKKSA